MRVKLDRAIGWRGVTYSGECNIPDDLAIALGLHSKPPPDVETLPGTIGQLPALKLLNRATVPAELDDLPTVGETTAKTLIERRPEGGYESLDQAEELNSDKTWINWAAIALWEGK